MSDMTTAAVFFFAMLSSLVALIAIVWLSRVSRRLSILCSEEVLEPESLRRTIQAEDKMKSLGSRIIECERKADECQNGLVEHQERVSEVTVSLGTAKQVMHRYEASLTEVSGRLSSLERRFGGIETSISEKLSQLPKHKTELNELADKLRAVEETVARNVAGLVEAREANRTIKTLKDKIENLKKFQIVTQKAHGIMLAAFTEMGASTSPGESLRPAAETAEPEDISPRHEEETERQETLETAPLSTVPTPSSADTGSCEAATYP
jgi:prefoldin subunit 5